MEDYLYDERNRLIQKNVKNNVAKSQTNPDLQGTDITTCEYDLQGSLLREESADFCRQYLYNDFHQCIQTDVICGREEEAERIVQENLYDGEGLRFALIENGNRTGFITDGWDNVTELDGNGRVTKRIIRGMGIAASEDIEESVEAANVFNASYHYYHGNERMDVEYITDESGNVRNSYTYDAFGGIISSSENIQNRYTYNGEVFDKTTEQYYLRKRYYNPKLCRFTQEDEYRGDGLNLYAFCANNPVMYVDPSGYGSVSYTEKPIYIDGVKIGKVSYKTEEYLDIQINKKFLPKNSSTSGFDIGVDTQGQIYMAFREKNSLIRGKNVENIIATAVNNQHIQIGDGLDGKFPIIDLSNSVEAVSVKSLNEYCKSYKNANGDVDIDAVCNQLMGYYNKIDDIQISINGKTKIDKTLLAALNGKNCEELKSAIRDEMEGRINQKYEQSDNDKNGNKRTKCMII